MSRINGKSPVPVQSMEFIDGTIIEFRENRKGFATLSIDELLRLGMNLHASYTAHGHAAYSRGLDEGMFSAEDNDGPSYYRGFEDGQRHLQHLIDTDNPYDLR